MSRLTRRFVSTSHLWLALAALFAPLAAVSAPAKTQVLDLYVYTADDDSFDVNSTLIFGKTEAILVDAQSRDSDATKVADHIAAVGKKLKAIFITHPDDDHYGGIAIFHQRFPQTPIYMTQAALDEFNRTAPESLVTWQSVYLRRRRTHLPSRRSFRVRSS